MYTKKGASSEEVIVIREVNNRMINGKSQYFSISEG